MGIQTKGAKKGTCKHSIQRREKGFQKKAMEILVEHIHTAAAAAAAARKRVYLISLDESFFFYDSLVRRVWIDESKRPVVRVTDSHKQSCIFGAINIEGNRTVQTV